MYPRVEKQTDRKSTRREFYSAAFLRGSTPPSRSSRPECDSARRLRGAALILVLLLAFSMQISDAECLDDLRLCPRLDRRPTSSGERSRRRDFYPARPMLGSHTFDGKSPDLAFIDLVQAGN
jgi:hypothetical protein